MTLHPASFSQQHPNLVDATYSSNHVPLPSASQLQLGYGSSLNNVKSQQHNLPVNSTAVDSGSSQPASQQSHSALQQQAQPKYGKFNEEWEASRRGSSIIDGPTMQRSASVASQGDTLIPSRGGTLKKKASLKRGSSIKRSGSRRSSRAGSVRSLGLQADAHDEMHSAFFSPVPTTGNPTEILANRFSGSSL